MGRTYPGCLARFRRFIEKGIPALDARKTHVAFVIPTLDQSGAERQLMLLATHLPVDLYQVHVITLNRGGFYQRMLEQQGINVDVLHKRFRFDVLTWFRLRRKLKELKPDIVHSYLFAANAYVRLPGVTPGSCRVIVSERCVDSWKASWQIRIDRWLAPRAAAMVANSQSVGRFYQQVTGFSESTLTVIPNAIAEDGRNEEQETGDLRKQLGLTDEHELVGYVGRLASQKCLHDLVWAFQMLHQCVENEVALIIAGDGPDRERLAELASSLGCREKVFFLGHRDDASTLISEFDVFCLPSSFEGMSNSLMEAMLHRVPVVVSDIEANQELVTHEQTGLVYPLGNCPDMTRAMKRLLDDRQFAGQLASAASDYVSRNHSIQLLVERHQQLYQSLLADKSIESIAGRQPQPNESENDR